MNIPAPENRRQTKINVMVAGKKGFTLIELLIVMTIVGILASLAVPNYKWGIIKAKEAVLREDLYNLTTTIDNYYADQGKYPDSLNDLVEKKYVRKLPKDPFTNSSETWRTLPPPTGDGQEVKGTVYEVRSGSELVGTNGKPYSEWEPGQ